VNKSQEGRRSALSPILLALYSLFGGAGIRRSLRRLALRLEGNEYYSQTTREMLRRFHGIEVGLYTYGSVVADPNNLGPETVVGRYCSVFPTVIRQFAADRPLNLKSTHPFFYDSKEGIVEKDLGRRPKLSIGNDVFIGHKAVILSSVESIGDGAVVAAGAVISGNIPPYAVVAGHPARVVRYRFTQKTIDGLLDEKWWLRTVDDLKSEIAAGPTPLETTGPVR